MAGAIWPAEQDVWTCHHGTPPGMTVALDQSLCVVIHFAVDGVEHTVTVSNVDHLCAVLYAARDEQQVRDAVARDRAGEGTR